MKNSKFLVALACLSMLVTGCGGNASSEPAGSSGQSSSAPASTSSSAQNNDSSSASSSSSSSSTPQQNPVTQTVEADADGYGETISWDAQDANKEADGFSSAGKFNSNGSYVKYTFTASMAMKARLFVTIEDRSSGVWDRATQKGNQSIWYNWYDGDDWKYNVEVNGASIDQSQMGTYKVDGEDIPMKELVYSDFLVGDAKTLEAPWFEFDVKQGSNTLRIERNLGYSVNMKAFKVVGRKEGAPAKVEGYDVTFVTSHCKVLVYESGQNYTVDPVEPVNNVTKTRTDAGVIAEYVAPTADTEEVKPQVNFKVVPDNGYKVTDACIVIGGVQGTDYNNLKGQGNGIYRVTVIRKSLTITITAVEDTGGDTIDAGEVKFTLTNCTVKVYIGEKNADGSNVDAGPKFYGRDKTDPTQYNKGDNAQFHFEIVPAAGFKFVDGFDAETGEKGKDDVDWADGSFNKVKKLANNYYRLTKVAGDVTLTINCVAE